MTPGDCSLLLVGCGKMGAALLSRWRGIVEQIDVIEPHASAGFHPELSALPANCRPDIIVFAVKPQQLEALLPAYRQRFGATPLYLSIAAGKPIAFFRTALGEQARIIRAMPNTPALIGHGMTALYAPSSITEPEKQLADALMQAVGKTVWLTDEAQLHAVTALSGSGPAYAFLFLECLVEAGIKAGLDANLARMLAVETLSGACALATQSDEPLAELRQNVTSPGGTTEAALAVLRQNGALETLIEEAVHAAHRRAQELAQ